MLLSAQEFAVAVGVNRSMVYKARDTGLIEFYGKKIDTDAKLNSMWIRKDNSRAESFAMYQKQNGSKQAKQTKTEPKQFKHLQTVQKPVKQVESETVTEDEHDELVISDSDSHASVVQKTALAKMLTAQETYIGKKLDNLERRNDLAPRQTMEFIISRMANMITSGIKVVAQTGLTDIGKEKGITYTNEEFQILENACLEMVNRSLESIQKEIENNF